VGRVPKVETQRPRNLPEEQSTSKKRETRRPYTSASREGETKFPAGNERFIGRGNNGWEIELWRMGRRGNALLFEEGKMGKLVTNARTPAKVRGRRILGTSRKMRGGVKLSKKKGVARVHI